MAHKMPPMPALAPGRKVPLAEVVAGAVPPGGSVAVVGRYGRAIGSVIFFFLPLSCCSYFLHGGTDRGDGRWWETDSCRASRRRGHGT